MIHIWSLYDKKTGLFTGQKFGSTDPTQLNVNIPEGLQAVEGDHDHLSCRVDLETGDLVEYQPPAPSDHHEWCSKSKRWKLNEKHQAAHERRTEALARILHLEARVQPRTQRELLLAIADKIGVDATALKKLDSAIEEVRGELTTDVAKDVPDP